MPQAVHDEVFTADELASAAGVERAAVDALIATGELRVIDGTGYVRGADAIRAGRILAAAAPPPVSDTYRTVTATDPVPVSSRRRPGMPAMASSLVHALFVAAIIWSSTGTVDTTPIEEPPRAERLVFLITPGPGGGGGGGGLRNPLPAPQIRRQGAQRPRVTVPRVTPRPVATTRREEPPREVTPPAPPEPKPVEREPDPLPARVLVAPVVSAAPDSSEREGVIADSRSTATSQGQGSQGGAGTGQGTGSGEGAGAGIGPGAGGGTGGGPYRPGSGITPPRLLREVKPEYTDEARRRGLTGDVVLEVVVRSDGTVGDVRLLQGLGSGLDQRAIAAIRQWRFTPARRLGTAVDVIVEIAVEFTLR